jgi:hypothetical protein
MDEGLGGVGRLLIVAGLGLAAVGLFLVLGGRVPGLGHLPGDIVVRRGNTTFYLPIVTCLLVSVVLTLVLSLLRR